MINQTQSKVMLTHSYGTPELAPHRRRERLLGTATASAHPDLHPPSYSCTTIPFSLDWEHTIPRLVRSGQHPCAYSISSLFYRVQKVSG